jgi:tetratricopeptide (TPR) repeat protein
VVLLQTEASAWKEVANAHRYRGQYEAATRALDAADKLLVGAAALGHDRAIIRLTRALTLSEQDRGPEALDLIRECMADFSEYGDRERQAQCLQLRGMIEHRSGCFREAIASYENALDCLDEETDSHTRACLLSNTGQAYGELQETDSALQCLREALALFAELDASLEVARTAWGLGRTLLAAERYAESRSALVAARRDLLRLMLREEAGLAGLDLADVHLATGSVTAAANVVKQVVEEFRAAQLNARALVALRYLSDVLPTPRARSAMRHVRTYIDELRKQPELLFIEPPDG